MARKRKTKAKRKAKAVIDEKGLTKGQLRKLNALRKSLGEDIADKAFAEWYATFAAGQAESEDKNAVIIAQALLPLIERKKLRIPRGGYLVTRGRGRVIVTRPGG